MEDLQHSCAFTDHRPYKLPWKDNEKDPRFITFQDRLKGQITALVDSGITDFYTGMAEGTDLWAGKAVLQLRRSNPAIRLHCIIPYADQPYGDKWGMRSQVWYFRIRDAADEVKELSHDYYDGCLLDCNRYMVDHAGTLLAVYNGEYRGGTAATVRYARKLDRKIIIIDPTTGKSSRDEG